MLNKFLTLIVVFALVNSPARAAVYNVSMEGVFTAVPAALSAHFETGAAFQFTYRFDNESYNGASGSARYEYPFCGESFCGYHVDSISMMSFQSDYFSLSHNRGHDAFDFYFGDVRFQSGASYYNSGLSAQLDGRDLVSLTANLYSPDDYIESTGSSSYFQPRRIPVTDAFESREIHLDFSNDHYVLFGALTAEELYFFSYNELQRVVGQIDSITYSAVPLPGAMLLFGFSLAFLPLIRLRRSELHPPNRIL